MLEVLTANGVDVIVQENNGFIANAGGIARHSVPQPPRRRAQADGIALRAVPQPAGRRRHQYNPPNGGPADTNLTSVIEKRANELLAQQLKGVQRQSLDKAWNSGHLHAKDLVQPLRRRPG